MNDGHAPCRNCDVFTFVYTQRAMDRLPPDYFGERCPDCNMHMARIDKMLPDHKPPPPATLVDTLPDLPEQPAANPRSANVAKYNNDCPHQTTCYACSSAGLKGCHCE